jgi:cell division protein FtsB
VSDDGTFGYAIHDLLKELGWTHGELTSSLVHQALAQVRHLRKMAAEVETLKARVKEYEDWTCPRCGPREFDAERIALEARVKELEAERDSLREFIAASEEVAKAKDALWYAEEYERVRVAFEKMAKTLADGGALAFKASGCEWCGAMWPKPEGSTLEQIHERARRHVYSCKAHPMKIERDSLRDECERMRSMRPVFEAAIAWRYVRVPGAQDYAQFVSTEDVLWDAIDDALAKEPR